MNVQLESLACSQAVHESNLHSHPMVFDHGFPGPFGGSMVFCGGNFLHSMVNGGGTCVHPFFKHDTPHNGGKSNVPTVYYRFHCNHLVWQIAVQVLDLH